MILFGSAFWDKQNVALVLNFLTFPVDDTTTKLRKHLSSLKTLFCRVEYPVMINSKYRCTASEPNGAQYVVFFQRRRKSNHSDGPNKIANWSPEFRSLSKHQFKPISIGYRHQFLRANNLFIVWHTLEALFSNFRRTLGIGLFLAIKCHLKSLNCWYATWITRNNLPFNQLVKK